MIALLQRVSEAWVDVAGERIAGIGQGLMVLMGVQRGDDPAIADRLLERLLGYRVFADAKGKMNLSIADTAFELLLVPQFTLAADTRQGRRPSFTPAAEPVAGQYLFDYFVDRATQRHPRVAQGRFGADMQVGLVNDGPVTFWLQYPPVASPGDKASGNSRSARTSG
jgi:D-tyrosyl-tRNA(Tyr) deacylase